ncbi:MAG TPA: hypothetical protein VGS21_07865 [Acidimicrobiales bacterium]|nr:hypothetical protein [Acidimicrobiales bacterium]
MNMRERGNSFAGIAGSLGLRRSSDALAAYRRALHHLPEEDRAEAVKRELGRIEEIERRIRARDAGNPEKMTRRLAALDGLRQGLE